MQPQAADLKVAVGGTLARGEFAVSTVEAPDSPNWIETGPVEQGGVRLTADLIDETHYTSNAVRRSYIVTAEMDVGANANRLRATPTLPVKTPAQKPLVPIDLVVQRQYPLRVIPEILFFSAANRNGAEIEHLLTVVNNGTEASPQIEDPVSVDGLLLFERVALQSSADSLILARFKVVLNANASSPAGAALVESRVTIKTNAAAMPELVVPVTIVVNPHSTQQLPTGRPLPK